MMMGGGLLWSFDVSSVEEMRRRVRGVGGEGKVEVEDEEFREWVADVLGRNREKTRDWKEGDGQDRVADARGTGNEREKPR